MLEQKSAAEKFYNILKLQCEASQLFQYFENDGFFTMQPF